MIEHLQSHLLGLIHVLAALTAMILGAGVLLNRKGTRTHRLLGRGYLLSMLAMNGTALLNFELYGQFGPFHWMVLASLATLLGGFLSARRRSAGWLIRHAYLMATSYVGLMAAAVAEVASRVPGWSFGASVTVSSAVVMVIGFWIMFRTVPRIAGGPGIGRR